ncbi:hypothetical protein PENSUB_7886 [Penicillium subrubescens]|uniref:N-acetyltransferase domain-containing protein n=2 Tax=Penicillium subrubescens TaxID=1316194 RepID=A0A1Q5TJN2_9EURO|nr:hypothetical protein PENSUB_7886 [Penicillium subrubescens]
MTEGIVLQSAGVSQMAREYPRRNNTIECSGAAVVPEKAAQVLNSEDTDIPLNQKHDSGAVVFLFPPNGHLPWSLSTTWLACKMWILEMFKPVKDNSCKDERVDKLMARHTSGKKALQARYPKLWYLEVIAVHPSLQSRGLGGAVMRAILEQVAGNPIFLECTRQENIGFYEGFGFKTIEEVELTDNPAHANEDGKLKYWVMVRETDST